MTKELRKERARLRKEVKALQDEIARLVSDRDMRWEVRAMHSDFDSVKHMVRGTQNQIAMLIELFELKYKVRSKRHELDEVLGADKEISKVQGEFVAATEVPRKKK